MHTWPLRIKTIFERKQRMFQANWILASAVKFLPKEISRFWWLKLNITNQPTPDFSDDQSALQTQEIIISNLFSLSLMECNSMDVYSKWEHLTPHILFHLQCFNYILLLAATSYIRQVFRLCRKGDFFGRRRSFLCFVSNLGSGIFQSDQMKMYGWGATAQACISLYVPAEYGSCFSMNSNSFLSYLALIHCSLSSLQVKSTEHF